jgi:hypothetical protein
VREGACIGAATILQPWTLRLILIRGCVGGMCVYYCSTVFIPITKLLAREEWPGGSCGFEEFELYRATIRTAVQLLLRGTSIFRM